MSRIYRQHDNHSSFPLMILIICAMWAHRSAIAKVERIGFIVVLSIVVALCLFWVIKVLTKAAARKKRTKFNKDLAFIDSMTWIDFEYYVANWLRANGYVNVRLTEKYDLGIDIIAEKYGVCWGVQVKHYNGLVGASAVRQVVTALKYYHCDRAIVVTNSVYSQTAQNLALANECLLIDRARLVQ